MSYRYGGKRFVELMQRHANKVEILSQKIDSVANKSFLNFQRSIPKKKKFIEKIEKIICSSKSKLICFGSLSTSLIVDENSDIDLQFFPTVSAEQRAKFCSDIRDNFDFRRSFMWEMFRTIQKNSDIGLENLISDKCLILDRTRIPLLILYFKNGYKADSRFRKIYIWLRTLFDALGIRDSMAGLFSSYHIACLVAHFLQSQKLSLLMMPAPVLPTLLESYQNLVGPDLDIEHVVNMISSPFHQLHPTVAFQWKSDNAMTTGELAIALVHYYTNIGLFMPLFIDRTQVERDKLKSRLQGTVTLPIFDPYSDMSVCRNKLGRPLRKIMAYTFSKMLKGQVISTFPDFKDTWFMKKLIQEEVSKIKFNINWQNDKRFSIKKRKGEEFVSRRRTINKNL
ncbi:unnamed protein product [Dracunculus medinensis]|uniref:PAP-associated domain-containing protein n=1 Tax=Dracunculus medinensis TaxID=318479 RepID=A0A0N4UMJ5_DRAME|nr:unnamed protein product [Dracunculus medinensis]